MQAIVRICGGKKNTDIRNLLTTLINTNKKAKFKEIIKALHPNGISEFKQKQVSYIENNWAYYQHNFKIPGVLSCCAEAINSHYFASRLSSRPKGFSITNIHKLGALLALEASNIKLNIFLQENIKELTRKNETKTRSLKPQPRTTAMPIFSYKNKQTKRLFKELIYTAADRFI